jgi:hypothetical protein
MWVRPVFVTVVWPRTPYVQAAPNATAATGGGHGLKGEVVNVQVKLVASELPNASWTPVVIVAVKVVFTARLFKGVKVATMAVESRETVPATLAPVGSATVNVAVVMVRGFIGLLKVAVMIVALGQATVEPVGGVTALTTGGVSGLLGFPAPAFLSGSLQPAMTTASKNAGIHILLTINLSMRFSSSHSHKLFRSARS